ncbi:MAG: energy transducer TonB [Erythrobacter sp.]|nr:energy transducer TonB [Erythrobacter sp.]
MRLRGAGCIAALALLAGAPAASQEQPGLTFVGTLFDVTGAGTLDLGDIDTVLQPFVRDFQDGREALGVEVTVDRDGTVLDCRPKAPSILAEAGEIICAHALKAGRFRQFPGLVLDYTRATYQFSVRTFRDKPRKGERQFRISEGFPLNMIAIRFGSGKIPPEEDRLNLADLVATPMEYPFDALQAEIEARVLVEVTFGANGRVETCRPLYSSNTPRMAYETCRAARQGFRLANPPEARSFIWITTWKLAD